VILRDDKDFTIECAIDDEWSQTIAKSISNVLSRYDWDENPDLDPVTMVADGIPFLIRYKKLS